MNRRSFIKALVVLPFALKSLGSVQPRALKVAWRASRRPVKFRTIRVFGLDADFNEIVEEMSVPKTFLRTRPYFDGNGDLQVNKVDQ